MERDFRAYTPKAMIHYHVTKPPRRNNSPLLVFLHYWGGSFYTWHKLTSLDSPVSLCKQYPTASIDFRGWGQSKGPVNGATAADFSITPLASDVVTVLERLKSDQPILLKNGFVLVGHSMGAKVALMTLSILPDDLQALIKGLVLVAPAPPTALVLPPEMAEQQQKAYDNKESITWTIQNVLANPEKLTEMDLDVLVMDSRIGETLAKDGWLKHGMQEDILPALDIVCSAVDTGRMKINVLAGELDVVEDKDKVEQEVVRALIARGFPVTFKVVEGVKHLIPLESPEAIIDAIRSL
ncbi:hydrolase [Exophiala viscosa]|uniref:Hydrolase n=1 Tax=Exophiala viscosa TaxID=2486360 RepID=A0AAN6E552_9EURO|nr:hydrolase [Exophiala viscosa]KAI1627308.1 hydrolase [Exophiala viscosa]